MSATFSRWKLLGIFLIILSHQAADPRFLADYTFEDSGNDITGQSPPIQFPAASITNRTLFLGPDFLASASIPALDLNSFTFALDFLPLAGGVYPYLNIINVGPSYRCLSYDNREGHLTLLLNNLSQSFTFFETNLATNQWHSLLCSVSVNSSVADIFTFLDGVLLLPIIHLDNFAFNVIGTPDESSNKAFTFWNPGNAAVFFGYADNFRVYNRAMTFYEAAHIGLPLLEISQTSDRFIIHWPSHFTGYNLQSSDSLDLTSWKPENTVPILISDHSAIITPSQSPAKFFRLSR